MSNTPRRGENTRNPIFPRGFMMNTPRRGVAGLLSFFNGRYFYSGCISFIGSYKATQIQSPLLCTKHLHFAPSSCYRCWPRPKAAAWTLKNMSPYPRWWCRNTQRNDQNFLSSMFITINSRWPRKTFQHSPGKWIS